MSKRKIRAKSKCKYDQIKLDNTGQAENHLVKLQQQDHAGPAGVVKGHQEDAEHPGTAADKSRDHAQKAMFLIIHHTVS